MRVSEPEVDCVGVLLQSYTSEGDRGGYVGEEGGVFVSEVVVLGLGVVCWADVSFIVFLTLDFGQDGFEGGVGFVGLDEEGAARG